MYLENIMLRSIQNGRMQRTRHPGPHSTRSRDTYALHKTHARTSARARERDPSQETATGGQEAGQKTGKRQRCCARKVLSELKAFKEALNKVEQIFKEAGHVCIFLPKYHPELNAIERYWGYIKHLLRLHCEYSLPHMLKVLPGLMKDVPLGFVRAWSRVTWLYVAAYDEGLGD